MTFPIRIYAPVFDDYLNESVQTFECVARYEAFEVIRKTRDAIFEARVLNGDGGAVYITYKATSHDELTISYFEDYDDDNVYIKEAELIWVTTPLGKCYAPELCESIQRIFGFVFPIDSEDVAKYLNKIVARKCLDDYPVLQLSHITPKWASDGGFISIFPDGMVSFSNVPFRPGLVTKKHLMTNALPFVRFTQNNSALWLVVRGDDGVELGLGLGHMGAYVAYGPCEVIYCSE